MSDQPAAASPNECTTAGSDQRSAAASHLDECAAAVSDQRSTTTAHLDERPAAGSYQCAATVPDECATALSDQCAAATGLDQHSADRSLMAVWPKLMPGTAFGARLLGLAEFRKNAFFDVRPSQHVPCRWPK